ncbi:hypothetical protein EK599_12825 [Vibrio sp. T187]|uniref:hypothetical protein n=1 Tax=Vibrio TaxID=662 RepID=UPI0010C9B18A|nr:MULTISPECIES: hypothetical protein [Vibrio]MBW3696581.1 hypothetical protein [Vibrio sp. T187]
MKKMNKLPLVAMISGLMIGCGGGGDSGGSSGGSGGGPSLPTYTWEIVALESVARSGLSSSCTTLADDNNNSDNVITAYKVSANNDIGILYHSSNGEVVKTQALDSDGTFTVKSGEVPDGGYVSLEVVQGSGNPDIHMLTIQKQFLSSMLLNVDDLYNLTDECYQGGQYVQPDSIDPDKLVDIKPVSGVSTAWYHSSYSANNENGGANATGVPVSAPASPSDSVLVTLFNTYSSGQATDLTHYSIMDSGYLYNAGGSNPLSGIPTDTNLTTDYTLNMGVFDFSSATASRIEVNINDGLYTWQPIYGTGQAYKTRDTNGISGIDGWSFNFSGTTDVGSGAWGATIYAAVENENDTTVVIPAALTTFDASIVSSGCSSLSDSCLSASGYSASDFNIQRTHLRSSTSGGKNFYQTIYATPNAEQPIMESSSSIVANIDNNNDRLEVSLGSLTELNETTIKLFMSENFVPQGVIDPTLDSFENLNGLVSMPSDHLTRRLALMGTDYMFLQNGVH